MDHQIRMYIENLFHGAPHTVAVIELREDIIQHAVDKYHDLLSEGSTPQQAYNEVISGIGDPSELIASVSGTDRAANNANASSASQAQPPQGSPATLTPERKNAERLAAVFLAVAVAMFILSVVPPILIHGDLGPVLMFLMIAIGVGLIIYRSYILKAARGESSLHDDDEDVDEHETPLMKSINGAVTALTLVAYFLFSFATGMWYISWVIFLIGGAVKGIIKAFLDLCDVDTSTRKKGGQ